jgi:hypothetical protein
MPVEGQQSKRPPDGHAERAARFDTLELEERLGRVDAEHRAARAALEQEFRREHWGRMPEASNR